MKTGGTCRFSGTKCPFFLQTSYFGKCTLRILIFSDISIIFWDIAALLDNSGKIESAVSLKMCVFQKNLCEKVVTLIQSTELFFELPIVNDFWKICCIWVNFLIKKGWVELLKSKNLLTGPYHTMNLPWTYHAKKCLHR